MLSILLWSSSLTFNHSTVKSPSLNGQLLRRLALPQLVVSVLALTTFHVQIVNRISSGYVLWYLYLAQLLMQTENKSAKWTKVGICGMMCYGIIQTGLFTAFLPPAWLICILCMIPILRLHDRAVLIVMRQQGMKLGIISPPRPLTFYRLLQIINADPPTISSMERSTWLTITSFCFLCRFNTLLDSLLPRAAMAPATPSFSVRLPFKCCENQLTGVADYCFSRAECEIIILVRFLKADDAGKEGPSVGEDYACA